jgi:thymidylate synthase (FAD)|tara:strand:- start:439 stop:1107 length:669 start_codon:yes stop_codon:yes gene_type:complete
MKVTYIDHMGSDLSVVNAARVSFGKSSKAIGYTGIGDDPMVALINDMDKKLIKYLAKHKHTSPFGHAFASFHIKAPIFVARQLVKHKFLRWNEISRRYVDEEPEFYNPTEWRGKSADKKQGSEGVAENGFAMGILVDQEAKDTLLLYTGLIKQGIAPEMARMVLPQSTMTEWYWSGSLDALADMCNLRCAKDTQLETRMVADQIDETMSNLFPVAWKELRNG